MLKKILSATATVALLMSAAVACSGGEKPAAKKEEPKPAAEAETKAAPAAVPAEKGTVEITVNYAGEAPKMPKIKKDADPNCGSDVDYAQDVVVNNGKLVNAIVHVSGVPGTYEAPQEQIMMDQKGCMYRPHVAVVQEAQTVAIHNSDGTLHNVHTYDGKKTLFNQAQPPNGPAITKTFEDGARVIKFTCDVHPWMTGWIMVNDHPFQGVSDESGKVVLKDVPVGTYKVEVWQETLGTQTVEVTVQANQTTSAEVTFQAG